MKKEFSNKWISSKQPRKQRKYRYNAPLHLRHEMLSAHLDKQLRKDYKRRSVPLKTGDEVKVMRGSYKGKEGKISKVDMKKLKIYMDNIKKKKVSGQEVEVALDPSNVKIIKLNLDDPKRFKKKANESTKVR